MKSNRLLKPIWSAFILIPLVCVLVLDARAQTCDANNSPPVNKAGWIKGSNVLVYIDPTIEPDLQDGIAAAFINWNTGTGSNGNNSGVTYTIVDSPPPAGSYSFTITTGTLNGVRGDTTTFQDANGHTIGAETVIDSRVTAADVMTEVMSHEIGHPAGFGDCTSCAVTDSVMALGATDYNQMIGRPTTPTYCDDHVLQSADYPYCNPPVNISDCQIWDPNLCTCNQYVSGGGGGSGGGYDEVQDVGCTDYYWVWYASDDGGATWYSTGEVDYAVCF